jgi:flavin reductase ActVB
MPEANNGAEPANVSDDFKFAMSRLAAGVVMVTCHVDDKPWGLTVSACCSVSMDPPLLLVSLGKDTTSAHAIARNGRFGVGLLGESLVDVAQFGAARGQAKFMDDFCHNGEHACASPVVAGALAHVDCFVEQTVPAGDHTIFIGAVMSVLARQDDKPLVYYSRSYHRLSDMSDLHVAPERDETVDSLLYDYPVPRKFSRGVPLGL